MPGTVKSRSFQMLSVTNVTIVIEKILLDKSHFITGTYVIILHMYLVHV